MTRERRKEVLSKVDYIRVMAAQGNNLVQACKRAGVTVREYQQVVNARP